MESFEYQGNSTAAIEPSMNARVCAISLRYRARGLVKAVEQDAQAQVEAEQKTVELAPQAYRLSSLSDGTIAGVYRGGKESMEEGDLIRYFNETRAMRTRACDFSDSIGIYEAADPHNADESDEGMSLVAQENDSLMQKIVKAPRAAMEQLTASIPTWFSFGSSQKREKKGFPLSALAAIIAIAISLMLIVASSVMLTRAESRINSLTVEADVLAGEVAELQSDVNVQNNLLELREIAVDQYGMVEERYVDMTYLDTEAEDTIEGFEEERDEGIGLSALLSALGIK